MKRTQIRDTVRNWEKLLNSTSHVLEFDIELPSFSPLLNSESADDEKLGTVRLTIKFAVHLFRFYSNLYVWSVEVEMRSLFPTHRRF